MYPNILTSMRNPRLRSLVLSVSQVGFSLCTHCHYYNCVVPLPLSCVGMNTIWVVTFWARKEAYQAVGILQEENCLLRRVNMEERCRTYGVQCISSCFISLFLQPKLLCAWEWMLKTLCFKTCSWGHHFYRMLIGITKRVCRSA